MQILCMGEFLMKQKTLNQFFSEKLIPQKSLYFIIRQDDFLQLPPRISNFIGTLFNMIYARE